MDNPNDAKKTGTPDGTPATPNVQHETAKTGREPGDGVGDSPKQKSIPVKDPKSKEPSNAPKDVDEDVWAQARHAAENMGGLHGVDEAGREALIRGQYDQMVENDKQTKRWGGDGGVLGDV